MIGEHCEGAAFQITLELFDGGKNREHLPTVIPVDVQCHRETPPPQGLRKYDSSIESIRSKG